MFRIKRKIRWLKTRWTYWTERLEMESNPDAYYLSLQQKLQTEHGLPKGRWCLPSKENQIVTSKHNRGGYFRAVESKSTAFKQKTRAICFKEQPIRYMTSWHIRNHKTILVGEHVLFVLTIRSVDQIGKGILIAEDRLDYYKEVFCDTHFSEEWSTYYLPFKSSRTYPAGRLRFSIHFGYQKQTLEFGGLAAINYGRKIQLSDLPKEIFVHDYIGQAPNANWRKHAAINIDKNRKVDLRIQLKDEVGAPIENAKVAIKMMQHDYAFGTAMRAQNLISKLPEHQIYKEKLLNLDGKGHGFNWVAPENSLTWKSWEDEWFISNEELAEVLDWIVAQGIRIKGIVLIWAEEAALPKDIIENRDRPKYVKDKIMTHLSKMLTHSKLKKSISEWSLLNELIYKTLLTDVFKEEEVGKTGREIYREIFLRAQQLNPNIAYSIDDAVSFGFGDRAGDKNYDLFISYIRELQAGGAKIDNIGVQGHIKADLNPIQDVLDLLDDYKNQLGLKVKITEFDLCTLVDEELAGAYLKDFMTAVFSHENTVGFNLWSFWHKEFYMNGGATLFDENWQLKPAGKAYIDLVFNEWWTNESHVTNAEGLIESRVFKGDYEITYELNGEIHKKNIQVVDNQYFEFSLASDSTNLVSV